MFITNICFGLAAKRIAEDKGRSSRYFWLGIVLGVVGMAITLSLENRQIYTSYEDTEDYLKKLSKG
jgi:hypothetical protein